MATFRRNWSASCTRPGTRRRAGRRRPRPPPGARATRSAAPRRRRSRARASCSASALRPAGHDLDGGLRVELHAEVRAEPERLRGVGRARELGGAGRRAEALVVPLEPRSRGHDARIVGLDLAPSELRPPAPARRARRAPRQGPGRRSRGRAPAPRARRRARAARARRRPRGRACRRPRGRGPATPRTRSPRDRGAERRATSGRPRSAGRGRRATRPAGRAARSRRAGG